MNKYKVEFVTSGYKEIITADGFDVKEGCIVFFKKGKNISSFPSADVYVLIVSDDLPAASS